MRACTRLLFSKAVPLYSFLGTQKRWMSKLPNSQEIDKGTNTIHTTTLHNNCTRHYIINTTTQHNIINNKHNTTKHYLFLFIYLLTVQPLSVEEVLSKHIDSLQRNPGVVDVGIGLTKYGRCVGLVLL